MLNCISLVGRVGQDPEVKVTQAGNFKTTISLATDRKVGQDKKTDWHKVEMWGKAAESAGEHIKKGDTIAVTGSLEYNIWEKDGAKRKDAVVSARTWNFCGGGKKDGGDRQADAYDAEVPF